MTYKFLVFVLVVGISFAACGQSFLVLEKMGTKKRFEYHQGEQIEIMLNNDDFFTRVYIMQLSDSSIISETATYNLSSIKAVKLRGKKTFFKIAGPTLMLAGIALILFDVTNQTIVQGGNYSPSAGVTIASVSLVGVGAIFTFAGRNKVELKKWWRLRTVQI